MILFNYRKTDNLTKQTEGLPNITGEYIPYLSKTSGGNYCMEFTGTPKGVFNITKTGSKNSYIAYANEYKKIGYDTVNFNALKGETKTDGTLKNDVYGKSDHVTPENYTIKIWKRIS